MTDKELQEAIQAEQCKADKKMEALAEQLEEVIAQFIETRYRLIVANGRKVCPKCNGYGAKERMDASYMRRFGLRDWDGCVTCGGSREVRGCGFISLA